MPIGFKMGRRQFGAIILPFHIDKYSKYTKISKLFRHKLWFGINMEVTALLKIDFFVENCNFFLMLKVGQNARRGVFFD